MVREKVFLSKVSTCHVTAHQIRLRLRKNPIIVLWLILFDRLHDFIPTKQRLPKSMLTSKAKKISKMVNLRIIRTWRTTRPI